MVSQISEGVSVNVEIFYQPDNSNIASNDYMFAYRITIVNNNNFPIKLLTRFWHILDSNGAHREIEGEGVVGVQPLINPGKQYQYISGCNLHSEIGKMYGTYTMENCISQKQFKVLIPAFNMVVPFKMN